MYDKKQRVPRGFTNFLEFFVVYIRDEIAIKNLGEEEGRRMTPFLCTLFFFILVLNLMGSIPLFTAATANPNVTGALAFLTLCFMVFGTISKYGFKGFLKAITPSGIPLLILPIPFFMEFIGVFTKAFALMIRLFANMLAGHIMISCLLGMVLIMGLIGFPALVLVVCIAVFEVFVVIL